YATTQICQLGPTNEWLTWLRFGGAEEGFGDWCVIPTTPYLKWAFKVLRPAMLILQLAIVAAVHYLARRFCCKPFNRSGSGSGIPFSFPWHRYLRAFTALILFSCKMKR